MSTSESIAVDNRRTANFSIDHKRSVQDPQEKDAIWVCVVSGDHDALDDPAAKEAAIEYVRERRIRGGTPTGYDRTFGPVQDNGSVGPPTGEAAGEVAGNGVLGVNGYLRMVAAAQMGKAAGKADKYVFFVRVRRSA